MAILEAVLVFSLISNWLTFDHGFDCVLAGNTGTSGLVEGLIISMNVV